LSAPRPDRPSSGRRRVFFVAALTVGIGLVALPIVLADGRELLRTAAGIHPLGLTAALLLTLLSYAAMSRSYQGIAQAAGFELRFRDWLRITFVSNTVNYLVTSAGLSGFAVRMYLLAQQGVQPGRAVLISLVQTALTNFTLLLFIMLGFATLVLRYQLSAWALGASSAAVFAFAGVLVFAVVLVYHRRLRRRTLLFAADALHRILRRVVPRWTPRRVRLWRFQHNLNEGLEFLFSRKDKMLAPAWWILLDWVLTMAILWAAFRSVSYPISPGLVIIGFAVGVCLSLVSLVPGGLGVMESSMTAVFVSLGVPLEPSVVAVLIFRVSYYVLPLLISLFFFHGLMLQAARTVSAPRAPDTPQI
jgi:glycosyltransferase 2 family protein